MFKRLCERNVLSIRSAQIGFKYRYFFYYFAAVRLQDSLNSVDTKNRHRALAKTLHLLVADTGVSSSTKTVVTDVRRSWQADSQRFERIFDGCAEIAVAGRAAVQSGDQHEIGRLMTRNHELLVEMTVSSPELNHLVAAAEAAGALGAKLSGGGRGGNMIALVAPDSQQAIYAALSQAGAASILYNQIG